MTQENSVADHCIGYSNIDLPTYYSNTYTLYYCSFAKHTKYLTISLSSPKNPKFLSICLRGGTDRILQPIIITYVSDCRTGGRRSICLS